MYRKPLATMSLTALLLGTVSAGALAASVEDKDTSDTIVLRGSHDESDRAVDTAASFPATLAPVRLEAAPKPADGISQFASSWNGTARSIAIGAFHWDGAANGAGVTIGIVDSGIDLDHPEFAGRVLPGACFSGGSTICSVTGASVGGDPGVYPSQSTHGTHVAGIAAGASVGLATGAMLLPVKVCDTYSSSCPGDVDSGIIWASQNGASVINLSLGGSTLSSYDVYAAATAINNGAVIVVAAGNGGNAKPAGGYLAGAALKDGVRGAMIVVGATGYNNEIASFSQTPGSTCEVSGGVSYCMRDYFVVAPGQGITSSVGGGGYGVKSGTSMATPYVTGVAALIKGEWPTLSPYDIADIIFQTAYDLGDPGVDNIYGRGAVDVQAAMSPVGGSWVVVPTDPNPGDSTGTEPPPPDSGTTKQPGRGKGRGKQKQKGARGALSTMSLGVMSAAFQSSKLLKNVELVDVYGRNFDVDLTKAALSSSFSLTGALRDPFRRYDSFMLARDSELGTVSVSGFVDRGTAPNDIDPNAAALRNGLASAQNVALSVAPSRRLSFDFGYNLYLSGRFNDYDVRASRPEDDVFLSAAALNSPYLALSDGSYFTGMSYTPVEGVKLRAGYAAMEGANAMRVTLASLDNSVAARTSMEILPREAHATMAGASWDFTDWGGLGLTASQTVERNGVLGGLSSGAFAIADYTSTTALGASARLGMGDGWSASFAWNEGVSRFDLAPGGLVREADAVRSRAYGVALQKRNLFGSDTVGIALTRPIHIYQGSATLQAATGVDADYNLVFGTERLSLATVRPETDLEFGYAVRLFAGRVSVQANAAYQMDVGGQPGANAIAALARAGMRF